MGVETALLKQEAVLWPFIGNDENGEPAVGNAIPIMVHWEEGITQTFTSQGTPTGSDATIDVDRDIEAGSRLWLGCIKELPQSGEKLINAVSVKAFSKIPDFKGRVHQRYVSVIKLPDIVMP